MAYRRLPAAPNLENLKNQAKNLLAAYRSGETQAVADFAEFHPRNVAAADAHLTDAQLVLARSYQQPSWQSLASAAQVQRALLDDGSAKSGGRFKETTVVKERNVRGFLRTFAPEIALDELQLVSRLHGDSVILHYGDDKVLKVAKNGSRAGLLKEARLYEHLQHQSMPVAFTQPLSVHEQGFYAVYSRVDGIPLLAGALVDLTPSQLAAAVRAIASFFTLLHKHRFPKEILELVPQGDDPYDVQYARLRKKIEVIAEQSEELDTAGWGVQLEQLEGALHQRWELIHCDPQLSHFYAVEGDC